MYSCFTTFSTQWLLVGVLQQSLAIDSSGNKSSTGSSKQFYWFFCVSRECQSERSTRNTWVTFLTSFPCPNLPQTYCGRMSCNFFCDHVWLIISAVTSKWTLGDLILEGGGGFWIHFILPHPDVNYCQVSGRFFLWFWCQQGWPWQSGCSGIQIYSTKL